MRLALSEIRANAMHFAAEWADATSERGDAQEFWIELFAVFGLRRKQVASFEEKVKNLKGSYDRIDVFYSGVMIGEHKSKGEDLSKAASQAFDYVQSLTREGRHDESPQYIVVSDFETIVVYDLDSADPAEPLARFPTAKLHENIGSLSFLSGYTSRPVDPEDPINIQAVEVLGRLHDALERGGYRGHNLEQFLVRVLFCLFADDTAIFENDEFKTLVKESRSDGSDLGALIARFFRVLDQDKPLRPPGMREELRELPFVNGELFHEDLGFADFNASMREALMDCCEFNWSRISPAVFGSLFQSIMAGEAGRKKRRQIGAHYTSERDIMKLVRSLFLDDLKAELEACGSSKKKLQGFQDKLASLRFLDPACGCGNFLVVTYRELRELELAALLRFHKAPTKRDKAPSIQTVLNIAEYIKVDVDQMHGIEIEEWPARIAEVAMWLIDHQMNQKVGEAFGQPVLRLPLRKSAKIVIDNALRIDWNTVLPAERCSYVLGNPPFVGQSFQSASQKDDVRTVWKGLSACGVLDYVTCWYLKATEYVRSASTRAAFVSTSSIVQGEQPGIYWPTLLRAGARIDFAHRTFAWQSEARGKAHVHVVIIGFSCIGSDKKEIVEYDSNGDESSRTGVASIGPYLVAGPPFVLANRSKPICDVPMMRWGNKPTDGGHLILSPTERKELLASAPEAARLVRRYVGGADLLSGEVRYCLWLVDAEPAELRRFPAIMARVERVRAFRKDSTADSTRRYADYPTLFRQVAQPSARYLAIPEVSSEARAYVPMAMLPPRVICSNTIQFLPNATLYHFGVLTSVTHMAWVRQVCGRLESRYRYSNTLVYNNFPWPQSPTDKQKAAVEAEAQSVLDARDAFKGQTLADLYDPLAMPKALRDAHRGLDKAVDKCYRAAPFTSERQRVEYLFDLYQTLVAPLTAAAEPKRRSKKT